MDRRKFLGLGIPAAGAILLAPGLMGQVVRGEVNRQFSGSPDFDSYDVLINGGGFFGYFAALEAAKQGKRVLLIEKRSYLGYELTAKGKFWLGEEGFDGFSSELYSLFIPEGEKGEVHRTAGWQTEGAVINNELALMAGSLKKGLLRNLLVNKADVLLMTDVCGLFSIGRAVQGALLACKQGLYAVKCRHFIDASEWNGFSRSLLARPLKPDRAGFVLEAWQAKELAEKTLAVPAEFGLLGNQLRLHPGKHADHQLFLEFEFAAEGLDAEALNQRARKIAGPLGKGLAGLHPALESAQITQFAHECSYRQSATDTPAPKLKSHFLASCQLVDNCSDILAIQQAAGSMIAGLPTGSSVGEFTELSMVGAVIKPSQWAFANPGEPGLSVPLRSVKLDLAKLVPNRQRCQVVVAGGGTAGAMAAIGAAEKGANTVVIDFFNDLGGTKTMCGVMGYYHGYRKQPFFKKQDDEANQLAVDTHMNKRLGRMQYLLTKILENGGRFFGGSILCGVLQEGDQVQGIVLCREGRLELIQADVSIDATGDGDIVGFAGAGFKQGDGRTGKTQDYSQWDVAGAGKMPSNTNRDYDLLDNTLLSEVQRGLFISHYEAHFYDFYPMLAVRESRRVEGVYEMSFVDVAEETHFKDVLSLASSDFDPHYVPVSAYSRCGFLLPHSIDKVIEIPYRCIVPKKLDGLLISGRALSATQQAYQFTRMTADLIVLGYLTGQIAADLSLKGVQARNYDVSGLQQEWLALGYLPEGYLQRKPGNRLDDRDEVLRRVDALQLGKREFLYECIKLPKEVAVPLLTARFTGTTDAAALLLLAKALAWFGDARGIKHIDNELGTLLVEERKTGYPAGFVDNYDQIRGRKFNMLEGLYWRINQNIALLAMAGTPAAHETVRGILENTGSGGPMMKRESDYFDGRIDLKLVPFHNRILNLCFYTERLPDAAFMAGFEKLLEDPFIMGHKTTAYEKVRWNVYGGDLELFIAAALARCGSKKGYALLTDYLEDVHFWFKKFAADELRALTGQELGYDQKAWKKLVESQSYPRPPVKLLTVVDH